MTVAEMPQLSETVDIKDRKGERRRSTQTLLRTAIWSLSLPNYPSQQLELHKRCVI